MELEDALARADGLIARLQAADAECAKADATAKASAEATAAHLGHLQEARALCDGTSPNIHPFVFHRLRLFDCLACLVVFMSVSSHALCVELERELATVRESSALADGAREELCVVMYRAAQKLGVMLDPNASLATYLATVMAAGREQIRQGVSFGVHTIY